VAKEELWFVILEGIASLALCFEIPFMIYVQKCAFFKIIWNWLHIGLTLACLSLWLVLYSEYLHLPALIDRAAFAEDVIVIVHSCANIVRTVLYIIQ
jgi:hypothetical protein